MAKTSKKGRTTTRRKTTPAPQTPKTQSAVRFDNLRRARQAALEQRQQQLRLTNQLLTITTRSAPQAPQRATNTWAIAPDTPTRSRISADQDKTKPRKAEVMRAEKRCKPRPNPNKKGKGSGPKRDFVPWCERRT